MRKLRHIYLEAAIMDIVTTDSELSIFDSKESVTYYTNIYWPGMRIDVLLIPNVSQYSI